MQFRKYIKVMSIGLQNELEYRFNFLITLFYSFIPFTVNILVWFGITNFSQDKFGLTLKEIVSYYFIILIVDNIIKNNMELTIANDIKTGNINKYLIKTIDYISYQFFLDLPKRIVFIATGGIPILIIGFFLRNYIVITTDIHMIAYFVAALLIGYIINFLLNFIISECSFFFSEVTGFFSSFNVLKNIVSGKIFPLNIIPKAIFQFIMITPFHFIGYFPAMILLNKFTTKEIINTLLIGVIWIIALLIFCRFLWKLGLKKYSAFGG